MTIVDNTVAGEHFGYCCPVFRSEVVVILLDRSRCGVVNLRRRSIQLSKPCHRNIEVFLVEHLAAVQQVAVDRENVGDAPLSVEAVSRRSRGHVGDKSAAAGQLMNGLDVEIILRIIQSSAEVRLQITRAKRSELTVVDIHKVVRG